MHQRSFSQVARKHAHKANALCAMTWWLGLAWRQCFHRYGCAASSPSCAATGSLLRARRSRNWRRPRTSAVCPCTPTPSPAQWRRVPSSPEGGLHGKAARKMVSEMGDRTASGGLQLVSTAAFMQSAHVSHHQHGTHARKCAGVRRTLERVARSAGRQLETGSSVPIASGGHKHQR